MTRSIQWAATLHGVRDITLRCSADPGLLQTTLAPLGLVPAEVDGRAQVLIVAADGAFHGVRFREISFSIVTIPRGDGDEAYLLEAYNSRWLFAWSERALFRTPYFYGDIEMTEAPLEIGVRAAGRELFHAHSSARPDESAGKTATGWRGMLWLPKRKKEVSRSFFFARMEGSARTVPATSDTVLRIDGTGSPALAILSASGLRAEEWLLREDAMHAKSKTYLAARVYR